jgi:hypothetical protein
LYEGEVIYKKADYDALQAELAQARADARRLTQERDDERRAANGLNADVTALGTQVQRLRDFIAPLIEKPKEMQALMRKHGLKIDDLDNPMQKLAFTLYTELCEIAHNADALAGGEGQG